MIKASPASRTLQTDVLDELDGMERDIAIFGLATPDRDQRRLMRYKAACYRRYRDAMDRLEPLRYVDSPLLALGPQPNSLPASAADAEPDRTESPIEAPVRQSTPSLRRWLTRRRLP